MVEVFRGSFLEAMNVKNLLENNNIIVFTGNEYMSSIDPWSVAAGGYVPAILKVNKEDYDNAKKVVDDFVNQVIDCLRTPFVRIGESDKVNILTKTF